MFDIPNFGRNPPIPVTFTHKWKEYKRTFMEVPGAAGYMWHLKLDRCHAGRMMWVQIQGEKGMPINIKDIKYHLSFHTQSSDLDYLVPDFID